MSAFGMQSAQASLPFQIEVPMTYALMALTLAVGQKQESAEKYFQKIAKKVETAKTLHVEFLTEIRFELNGMEKQGKISGAMKLGTGNKLRITADMTFDGKKQNLLVVSNGKKTATIDSKKRIQDTKEYIGEEIRIVLARIGPGMAFTRSSGTKKRLSDALKLAEFKRGTTKKIGKRTAQAIHYVVKTDKAAIKFVLWVDSQTKLPIQRTATVEDGKVNGRITETYSRFALNQEMDAKLFRLPKDKD